MDFGLNEEQEMLKTMARDFFTNECPKTHVKEMMDDEKGYSPELWKKMAELGFLGLVIPEEYGGTGGNFIDLMVLMQEMGRAVLPSPFISTVLLAGIPLLTAGTEEQKKEFLPKIAAGDVILALALSEPNGDLGADAIEIEAVAEGNDYIINGTKLFVLDAAAADHILCATRTKRTKDPEEGITLFLIDAKADGVQITSLKTMDETRKQCEVLFKNVKVPAKSMVGELHQGWPILKKTLNQATAMLCGEMVGGLDTVMEMTLDYAKQRIQFGVPIGSFQAIKHKFADMLIQVEYARSLTYYAAWTVDQDIPDSPVAVSTAKSWCGDAYKHVTNEGVQIHGGIGFTWDHDMHLYFKRARSSDTAFGDSTYHRELIAQSLNL
ncbi:Acyl-CoA dehydrogenase [subsurface metagenome]